MPPPAHLSRSIVAVEQPRIAATIFWSNSALSGAELNASQVEMDVVFSVCGVSVMSLLRRLKN
jgi:hypothetical protein